MWCVVDVVERLFSELFYGFDCGNVDEDVNAVEVDVDVVGAVDEVDVVDILDVVNVVERRFPELFYGFDREMQM